VPDFKGTICNGLGRGFDLGQFLMDIGAAKAQRFGCLGNARAIEQSFTNAANRACKFLATPNVGLEPLLGPFQQQLGA